MAAVSIQEHSGELAQQAADTQAAKPVTAASQDQTEDTNAQQSLLITDVPTSVLENVCTYLLGTPQDIASTMLACTALNKAAQPAWAVLEGHKKAWCDTCPMPELRGRNVDVEMLRKVVIPWTYGDSTATSSKSRTREVCIACLNSAQRKLIFVRADQIGIHAKAHNGGYERRPPRPSPRGGRGNRGPPSAQSVRGDMVLRADPGWHMDWDLRTVRVSGPQRSQYPVMRRVPDYYAHIFDDILEDLWMLHDGLDSGSEGSDL